MKKINKDVSINLRQKTALYKVKDKIIDRINYIEPNKYKKIIYDDESNSIYNKTEKDRITNILDYFINKMNHITDPAIRKDYITNFVKTYIMWYDIMSISTLKNLSSSTGMFKYVREYELENIFSFESFVKFYDDNKNNIKIKIIYDKINKIKERINEEKDMCNRKNDIIYYIENFSMFPEKIFNLLCLYIIYTKMYQFINIYSKDNKIIFTFNQQREKNRLLLLFGNINDTIYINNTVRIKIQEYMNHIIDAVKTEKNLNMEMINSIYQDIAKEYLP